MADREQQLEVIRLADQIRTATNVSHARALAAALAHLGVSLERTPAGREADDARLEKEIVRDADKQLRALGFEVVSIGQAGSPKGTRQTAGIADRRFYHRARRLALWWEAKTTDGEQRPDQRLFQELVESVGEFYVVGTDQDLYAWLIARGIAFEQGGLLVPLPYERTERSA